MIDNIHIWDIDLNIWLICLIHEKYCLKIFIINPFDTKPMAKIAVK